MNDVPVSVDAIVVCFNSDPDLLKKCTDSILAAFDFVGIDGSIVLVDNASSPPVGDTIDTYDFRVVHMQENVGFGRAVNFAVLHSKADFVLMLNPDAEVEVDSLKVFLAASSSLGVAVVGGWLESGGCVQSDAYMQWDFSIGRAIRRKAFTRKLLGATQEVFPVDKVCGGALFAPGPLLRDLGPFDPRFFLYGEDADMSRRALSRGVPLAVARKAVVKHVAASSQKTYGRLVEQARADAAIRLTSYHHGLLFSWLQRLELAVVTLLGAVAGGASSSSRKARLARLKEVWRWGVREDVAAFHPSSSSSGGVSP